MRAPIRLAVVGAGLVGRRHCAAIATAEGVTLTAVVDPAPESATIAEQRRARWFRTLEEMIDAKEADGVVIATPNTLHAEGAALCIDAGLPLLVEKPVFTDLAVGNEILSRAEAAGIPVASGHHRRHNPLIATAKSVIEEGRLGTLVSVHATTWFMKPDGYFETIWRRKRGAGPVFLNLIHDIDLLHHFCGPIVEVRAMESNAIRGYGVEETAAIILRFASGVLGTVNVSDTAVAPWSWELTARENPAYPATTEDCYWIAGTHGSLSLPNLSLWNNPGERSWWEPICATKLIFDFADPLVRQIEQFSRVIRDGEAPLVSGRDGLRALAVVEAIKSSAAGGQAVHLEDWR